MTQQALHLIDGRWQGASAKATRASINPADQSEIGRYADGTADDASAAIAAARAAFERPEWAQSPRLRQQAMLQWADRLQARAEELAQLLTRENGKVLAQSRGEIGGAISEIRYYAGLARHIAGHVLEAEPGVFSTMLKEPAGVAGLIVPWNAPVVLLIRSLAPALAAGCTAVIKPAPQSALITAAVIVELDGVAGLPKGVVNLVSESGHAVARALVASPGVDVLSFTGSNATGQRIMADAAPTMKRLSLELGGKSACLVFDDVDVASVATQLAAAATIISASSAPRRAQGAGACVALRRNESRARPSPRCARRRARRCGRRAGGGALIDSASLERVGQRIDEAMDAADEVVLRGKRGEGALQGGFFLTPTLVAHRDTDAFFVQEEISGRSS